MTAIDTRCLECARIVARGHVENCPHCGATGLRYYTVGEFLMNNFNADAGRVFASHDHVPDVAEAARLAFGEDVVLGTRATSSDGGFFPYSADTYEIVGHVHRSRRDPALAVLRKKAA